MADLTLHGVAKRYPSGVQALFSSDLVVKDGSFVVLVGPSGCGKSTLLRIVAGLEEATGGQVLLDGQAINDKAPADRDVAMVFQNYALYPHLTVQQNLEFGLRMRGVQKNTRQQQAKSVADLLQITELLQRKPPQLSGGQRQRVALGRAIVRQPKLFLLDEPFSNLDATLRSSTRGELMRLHRRLHATTLLVTHDQVEAMSMADTLVVMNEGRIQQIGAPMEVYQRPANKFVAQFIGSPPMNLLPAEISADGQTLVMADQRVPNPISGITKQRVSVGIRAEHIMLCPEQVRGMRSAENTVVVPAIITSREILGNEVWVSCLAGSQEVTVRMSGVPDVSLDQPVQLHIQIDRAVLFDDVTGLALAETEQEKVAQ